MARPISAFVGNFDGGARANLYRVTVPNPPAGVNLGNLEFFAKSAQLPASTLGEIAVPFMGRVTKVAGDRTYEDWTISILNREDMNLRKAFETWNANINQHRQNVSNGDFRSLVFDSTAKVEQLDRAGKVTRTYTMFHLFPKEVGSIDLAFDNNDTVSEFTVTLAYTYFELS
jgi:hypothetical protein